MNGVVNSVRMQRMRETHTEHMCITTDRYVKTPDFLDVLLEAYTGDEKTGLTLQDVRDEVDTFMFEGHDTTGSGLQWMLYVIAQHPEVEAKIIEEVDRVLGDRLEPDWEDLKSFPYMTKVIKETLRLYPPVPYITRLTEPGGINIMEYHIPGNVCSEPTNQPTNQLACPLLHSRNYCMNV